MTTFMKALLDELEQEVIGTRKMLAIVPADKSDWKPHPKSMSLGLLAAHVAEIPGWMHGCIMEDELDMATNPYIPKDVRGGEALVELFDEQVAKAREALSTQPDSRFDETWTMRQGDYVIMSLSKYSAVRHGFGQMIHHRAQLGVFLRLLDIPIPGVYGPSADEM